MQLEVGNILEGKVTGITKFGAFVELPGGKTGMVHISEVSTSYVNEIKDHLAENQTVKVKVINITEDGKVSLSIKKAMDPRPQGEGQPPRRPISGDRKPFDNHQGGGRPPQQGGFGGGSRPPRANSGPRRAPTYDWSQRNKPNENMSFEDMMNKFKQTSDDKMSDLKKVIDNKRGAANRRSGK